MAILQAEMQSSLAQFRSPTQHAPDVATAPRDAGGTAARKDGVRVFTQFAWLGVGSGKVA